MHNQKKDNNNLKTKNNQNGQKIKLYGNPTTKEIKKKHSSRPVGGKETGSRVERTRGKAAAGRPREVVDCGTGQARLQLADPTRWWLADPAAPHSHINKLGGTAEERSRPRNTGLQLGEIKPQTSD